MHHGHLMFFSACFQELPTTNPTRMSTSPPISHGTKGEMGSGSLKHLRKTVEFLFTSFQVYVKKVDIYNATIFLLNHGNHYVE